MIDIYYYMGDECNALVDGSWLGIRELKFFILLFISNDFWLTDFVLNKKIFRCDIFRMKETRRIRFQCSLESDTTSRNIFKKIGKQNIFN